MEQLGHFRILSRIGAGGMGEVYRARDENLQREVAIKVLPADGFADAAAKARLLREARSAAALNHTNICTVYEVGESEGQAFIAMEILEGRPLSERLAQGPLPPADVIRWGIQLADALAHAHDRDVVHRDLKPLNVIITTDDRLKVLDFGLAKRLGGEKGKDETTTPALLLTEPGTVLGTPSYMAPEQLRGRPADARSDIWSLGVMLYEMATGKRPFEGHTWPELSAAILTTIPAPPGVPIPAELEAVIARCLAKDPAQRYQRAGEVRAALEAIQTGVASAPMAPTHSARRWPLVAAIALIVVFALFVLIRRTPLSDMIRPQRLDSIAVLPLANLTGNAEQDYFVDGIHSGFIGELAQTRALRVISRTSMLRFKDGRKSIPEIARELHVTGIVEGSVMRNGNRVRLQLQLIDARGSERQVWAGDFECDPRDVIGMQRRAVLSMLGEAGVRLTAAEETRLATARTVDADVHQLYLKGMFHLGVQKPESTRKALALLHEANEKDPTDPLPYAGLARAYSMIGHAEDPQAFVRAKAAALKALELYPDLVEAQQSLAEIKLYKDWDYDGAAAAFRRVLELNPNLAAAHAHYAWYHLIYRRDAEALAEMKRAAELDPLTPIYTTWLGWIYAATGDSDQALAHVRRALELNPQFPTGLLYLGELLRERGMLAEAIEAHQKAAALSPSTRWALAETYAMAGRTNEARAILAELAKDPEQNPFTLAFLYSTLDMKGEAIGALEQAYRQRESLLPWLGIYAQMPSRLRNLRGHPGYRSLMRRLRLPA